MNAPEPQSVLDRFEGVTPLRRVVGQEVEDREIVRFTDDDWREIAENGKGELMRRVELLEKQVNTLAVALLKLTHNVQDHVQQLGLWDDGK